MALTLIAITYIFAFISAANLVASQLNQPPTCIQVCLGTGDPETTYSPSISRRYPQRIDVTDPIGSSGCDRTLHSWKTCACEWLKTETKVVGCANTECVEEELRKWMEELGVLDVCGKDVFPGLTDGDGKGEGEDVPGKNETETDSGDGGNQTETDNGNDGGNQTETDNGNDGGNQTETDNGNDGGNQTETDNGNNGEGDGDGNGNGDGENTDGSGAATLMPGAMGLNSGVVALVLGVGWALGL